jgi:hypothetical protein
VLLRFGGARNLFGDVGGESVLLDRPPRSWMLDATWRRVLRGGEVPPERGEGAKTWGPVGGLPARVLFCGSERGEGRAEEIDGRAEAERVGPAEGAGGAGTATAEDDRAMGAC